MLQQWDVGMAQQLALLQAEETSQPPADHGQSPVVFDAEGVVATRLVAGISSSPLPLQPAVPPHVEPYRHIRAHHLVHLQSRASLCQHHHRPRALAEECAAVLQMRP